MNILITYADKKYQNARKWNAFIGKHIAKFEKIYAFSPEDIDNNFKSLHSEIFSYKRGNGLWLWKPYFIDKVINECNEGDIVFYCDAGACFTKAPIKYIKPFLEDTPIFCCDIPLIESNFTKPICFESLNLKSDEIKYSNQIIATYLCLRVCEESRKLIKEWLDVCCNIELLKPEGCNINLTRSFEYEFVTHREDQSLFSLLCKKYGYKPHRDISQRGLFPRTYYNPCYIYQEPLHNEDTYPSMIWLHKSPQLDIIYFSRLFLNGLRDKIYKIPHR